MCCITLNSVLLFSVQSGGTNFDLHSYNTPELRQFILSWGVYNVIL